MEVLNGTETGLQARTKINSNFEELGVPLIEWAHGGDWQPINITYDPTEGFVTTATVLWPDGSSGVFTPTDWNVTHEAWDGYYITHIDSGQTVTQPAVTRNSEGAVTIKPQLIVS